MACLAYHPSAIRIDAKEYKREELLEFTTNMLQTIKKYIQVNNNNNDRKEKNDEEQTHHQNLSTSQHNSRDVSPGHRIKSLSVNPYDPQ